MRRWFILFFVAFLSLAGCGDEQMFYPLIVGNQVLNVELAVSPEERRLGLMHRESLPADRGMLFIFERDQQMAFWMQNTHIPLSIAYIDSKGVIKEIHHMEPLSGRSVESNFSVRYALEVNQGYFEEHGIEPGDKVSISDLLNNTRLD